MPGQYSSGGKARLGRITKAGDPYLRSLLAMGARSVLNAAKGKTDVRIHPLPIALIVGSKWDNQHELEKALVS